MLVARDVREGTFDSVLVIGLAVDAHSGLSDGSLKASLVAVIDQCRGRLESGERGRREGARVK